MGTLAVAQSQDIASRQRETREETAEIRAENMICLREPFVRSSLTNVHLYNTHPFRAEPAPVHLNP